MGKFYLIDKEENISSDPLVSPRWIQSDRIGPRWDSAWIYREGWRLIYFYPKKPIQIILLEIDVLMIDDVTMMTAYFNEMEDGGEISDHQQYHNYPFQAHSSPRISMPRRARLVFVRYPLKIFYLARDDRHLSAAPAQYERRWDRIYDYGSDKIIFQEVGAISGVRKQHELPRESEQKLPQKRYPQFPFSFSNIFQDVIKSLTMQRPDLFYALPLNKMTALKVYLTFQTK